VKLELRHIRCVLAVAKHLHFAHAAEELGIAPPSLTKQIQDAERLLQFRLFHRTKRSVSLTAAGHAYVSEATAALAALERAHERGQLAERGELGRIQIGYVASAAFTGVMQKAVSAFRQQRPRVDVRIAEIPMSEIPSMLADGRLDIAYVRPPMDFPENVQAVPVCQDEFVVALPEHSPLAAHARIAPQQLRQLTFALPEQDCGTFEVARRGRFQPVIGPRPGPLAAVLACVSLGDTVAVVPRAVCDCIKLPGVLYRPLDGKPVRSEIAIAFRRHERSQAVRAFLRHAHDEPASLGAEGGR
jgi:DNA-binding transcriptional LysR family regulator